MDGNKDEGERCARLAQDFLSKRLYGKALKFAQKAYKLLPNEENKKLLYNAETLAENYQNDSSENQQTNNESFNNRETNNESFSNEHTRSVDYIKNCKDYYEILGVSKNATDNEIKKQYKKLALQFHPDKNKAPGAAEAFKAIGNAFGVLSDPEKRRKYDQVGLQENDGLRSRRRSDGFDYTRGFDDLNAEEIFNVFFGGGFTPRNVYVHRTYGNGNMYHHHHARTNNQHESQATTGYAVLLQLMPILFFICISLLSNFVPENPYSLTKSHKYPYQRITENYQVPYYVKENFERDYRDSIHQIETHVEENYISNLQTSCFKERNYKENMIYRAKYLRDSHMESQAQNLKTPSCDRLVRIRNSDYS